jgi:PAS domain S-box-containing protein
MTETTDKSTRPRADSDLYRRLVDGVSDYAVVALDDAGHIAIWNAGAERLIGYTADEVIGKHFSIVYLQEDLDARKPARALESATSDGRFEEEGWRARKDRSRFWAHMVITALRDTPGAPAGFAMVTRDLTERRAAQNQALADVRRATEADMANRAKSDFLMAMSHELRTPLNAIGGYAELLALGLGGTVSERQREYLERIRKSQQHLMALINDILNFSRVEGGQIAYEVSEVSLLSVVDTVVPMIEPQAAAKHLRVTQHTDVDAIACADRAKVEQILINLLSNAVKYTDDGGQIDLSCAMVGDRAEVRVRDTGMGIPADKLGAIFEPFVQVGRSLTKPNEGTGLGLAISRDLARGMNGDLTVESTVGKGATFILTLPSQ